jgi:hypothetical protein
MTFMELHREVAFPAGCMYNDLQSIMYTLKPLRMTSAEAEVDNYLKEYIIVRE